RVLVEHGDVVPERREVAGDGERRRPRPDTSYFFTVELFCFTREFRRNVSLQIRGNPLQAADGDGFGLGEVFVLDSAAPAGGLAGTVAGAPEDAGEHVAVPV